MMSGSNMNKKNGNNNDPMEPSFAGAMPVWNKPAPAEPAAVGNACMDWDAELKSDGTEFLILPEGDYVFQVVNFERGYHAASARLAACNKATLTLEVRMGNGIARARIDLFLHWSMEWKISSFFRCIGLKKKGEPLKMDWSKVPGAWGRAHFKPGSFDGSDGKKHPCNEVIRFLDYDANLVKPGFTDVTDSEELPF